MPSTAPTSGWRSGGWRCATSSHIRSRASRLTTVRPATASSYATAPSVPDSSESPGRLTSATGTSASEHVQDAVWQLISVRVSVQGRLKLFCAPRRTLEGRAFVCEPLERTRESNHLEWTLRPLHWSLHPTIGPPVKTCSQIRCLTEILTELKATTMIRSLDSTIRNFLMDGWNT